MAEVTRILVLGATGYIGGSALAELLKHNVDEPARYTISALVRKPSQASKLADAGVKPLIFKDLDDFEVIRAAAKDHDICEVVLAAASARHYDCARACIEGLGERGKSTGKATHYIHRGLAIVVDLFQTSGASNVGDWPLTGDRIDTSIHSDVNEDIYEFEKTHPETLSPVRNVDLRVVELGERHGVQTYIVIPPLIFGPGTGLFTLGSGQVHQIMQLALKKKQAVMLGSGSGIWNRIHILDLSRLFYLLVQAILDHKSDLPSGKTGYYFAENGFQSWKSIAEKIGGAGKTVGAFETNQVTNIELQDAADVFFNGNGRDAEGVLGSNSRTKADRARGVLGWSPERGEEEFDSEIVKVVTAMYEETVKSG
ncbi:hypothetical protein LHYA1_G004183 [Lachnellula hyalina]|uniref:NAD(P)-binding domain-containing protein n=1 Tax=Lachnellula hyalina TaxID=1316788 RepID=A0A8H8R2P6_9HELO|nr:uncharacterized protein LHYA1_G004183 [Lachnellula hyalina]TVY27422.1 hypothetical protein LHYA1_G004183 [Lachnellula hyalina]